MPTCILNPLIENYGTGWRLHAKTSILKTTFCIYLFGLSNENAQIILRKRIFKEEKVKEWVAWMWHMPLLISTMLLSCNNAFWSHSCPPQSAPKPKIALVKGTPSPFWNSLYILMLIFLFFDKFLNFGETMTWSWNKWCIDSNFEV